MRTRTGKFYECKLRLDKVQEEGLMKKVTESYCVEAVSFSDAEARIVEEMAGYVTGEFEVEDIKKAQYREVFFSDDASADKWYKAKLQFITLDEDSGKEKRQNVVYLVQASSLDGALRSVNEVMNGTMIDYQSVALQETSLLDVYEHKAK